MASTANMLEKLSFEKTHEKRSNINNVDSLLTILEQYFEDSSL